MPRIDDRLAELGLELPPPVKLPAGTRMAFRPAQRAGNLLYLSGNGPIVDGKPVVTGKVGADVTVEQAYEAARITTLNLLAAARNELGSLDRITQWIKALGMVNSAPGFAQQPQVINGFSDLIVEIFGDEIGGHARSAVGMAELPWNLCVEIEAILAFDDGD
jgi:enamine deaminase RidA (YjgF/YER057c/UK114 family)